jgi:hypothetical protein
MTRGDRTLEIGIFDRISCVNRPRFPSEGRQHKSPLGRPREMSPWAASLARRAACILLPFRRVYQDQIGVTVASDGRFSFGKRLFKGTFLLLHTLYAKNRPRSIGYLHQGRKTPFSTTRWVKTVVLNSHIPSLVENWPDFRWFCARFCSLVGRAWLLHRVIIAGFFAKSCEPISRELTPWGRVPFRHTRAYRANIHGQIAKNANITVLYARDNSIDTKHACFTVCFTSPSKQTTRSRLAILLNGSMLHWRLNGPLWYTNHSLDPLTVLTIKTAKYPIIVTKLFALRPRIADLCWNLRPTSMPMHGTLFPCVPTVTAHYFSPSCPSLKHSYITICAPSKDSINTNIESNIALFA